MVFLVNSFCGRLFGSLFSVGNMKVQVTPFFGYFRLDFLGDKVDKKSYDLLKKLLILSRMLLAMIML